MDRNLVTEITKLNSSNSRIIPEVLSITEKSQEVEYATALRPFD